MKIGVLTALGLAAALCAAPVWAQKADPKAAPQTPAKADSKGAPKTASDKGSDKPAADGDASQGPAAKAFAAKLEEWKVILKELRKLRTQYQSAAEGERAALQKQWDAQIAKGNALVPVLTDLAEKAYEAAPNEDLELLKFLGKTLSDEANRDDYEKAYALAELLDKNEGFDKKYSLPPDAYAAAAAAAFAENDFEKAKDWLTIARDSKATIPDEWNGMFSQLENYEELWAKEKEIREKETADNDLPRVKLTTTKGTMVIELFENEAPETVGNFVSLVEKKFYDGLTFHRVLNHFMAQGGCPKGDGTGDPGYKIYCEVGTPEHKDDYRRHFRGSLSMAHAGKDTGGSQFFITFEPTPHLNGKHTVFGRVIEGLDVLAKLQRNPNPTGPQADKIIKAEVLRKRDHNYVPRKVEQ
jgi:cyclophilin family peptidyl-prolyl cis-trans isomerase